MLEKSVANEVLLAMSKRGTRLHRNNVATCWQGDVTRLVDGSILIRNPRIIHAGLCKGSSDYIGWHPLVITPEMVSSTVAVYTAVETKRSKGGRIAPEQQNFIDQVRLAGGMAGVANSVEAALSLYDQMR
jgi:hypothetical protein